MLSEAISTSRIPLSQHIATIADILIPWSKRRLYSAITSLKECLANLAFHTLFHPPILTFLLGNRMLATNINDACWERFLRRAICWIFFWLKPYLPRSLHTELGTTTVPVTFLMAVHTPVSRLGRELGCYTIIYNEKYFSDDHFSYYTSEGSVSISTCLVQLPSSFPFPIS